MKRTHREQQLRRMAWLVGAPAYALLIFAIFYFITGHKI